MGTECTATQSGEFEEHANIQVHLRKTGVWDSPGEEPLRLLSELPPEEPVLDGQLAPRTNTGGCRAWQPGRRFSLHRLDVKSRIPRVLHEQVRGFCCFIAGHPVTVPPGHTEVFASQQDAAFGGTASGCEA